MPVDHQENIGPWRCFHCGEVFTTVGAAGDHFGHYPIREPGCLIDRVAVEKGGKPERGRGLLMALRKVEAERDAFMERAFAAEDTEESLRGQLAEFQRRFGTTDAYTIWERYDDERFRAKHAVRLLDAHRIEFDQPTPSPTS